MKILNSFLFLIFFPLFGWAQSLNGVYTGVLSNDSTTVRRDQSFEMALTEYKGKVYGYAYSTFIINDTLYFIVKRVKGTVTGDICEVEDDEVVSHNFPKKPEKGVFVTYTLRRNITDSTWSLDGNWKTNATKKYYALSGKVDTKEEKDLSKSKLYEHLGDLNLQQTLAFNKPSSKKPDKKNTKTKTADKDIARNNVKADKDKSVADVINTDKNIQEPKPEVNSSGQNVAKTETGSNNTKPNDNQTQQPVTRAETKSPDTKSNAVAGNNLPKQSEIKNVIAVDVKPIGNQSQQPVTKVETKIPETKSNTVAVNNQPKQSEIKTVAAVETKPVDNQSQQPITKIDTKVPDTKSNTVAVNNQPKQSEIRNVVAIDVKPIGNQSQQPVTKVETKIPETKSNTVAVNIPPKQGEIKNNNVVNTKSINNNLQNPVNNTNAPVTNNQPKQNTNKDVVATDQKQTENKPGNEYEFKELSRAQRKLKPAVSMVDGRETEPSETITFKSDSLVLALYDNGEVDGDTVSVIINDEIFIEKQGLKSVAFKKTFYFSPEQGDSLLVVLFAENLGIYPPNTGLLIIKDGDDQHYVRFKADLDRNAAILLRKKYK